MKKLQTFVLVTLLFIATLLSITNNAFAQTTTTNTGNYITKDQRTGQFSVPANLETGVNFTNKTDQEVKVTISTEGKWSLGYDFPAVDANGFPQSYLGDYSKGLKYPDKAASSMLAVNKDNNPPIVNQVGRQTTITLAPGATLTFLNNDLVAPKSYYEDNTGSIIVKWSTPPAIDPGRITGLKWDDKNRNGVRDSNFIKGYPPDVVFVIDVSRSTVMSKFQGTSVGDVNRTGQADTILDAELAGFIALNNQLIKVGLGNDAKVGIVLFSGFSHNVDMDSTDPGIQLLTKAGTDNNRNGIPDVQEILASIQAYNQIPYTLTINGQSSVETGGTNFKAGLKATADLFGAVGTKLGKGNVIFLSDGQPDPGNQYSDEVAHLRSLDANIVPFGAGRGASLPPLQLLDPRAQIFTTTDDLLGIFNSLSGASGSNSNYALEPTLSGVTIYLDLNNNGVIDANEPSKATDSNGQYEFAGLQPGTYTVREVLPNGSQPTIPKDGFISVTLEAGKVVDKINFGNYKN